MFKKEILELCHKSNNSNVKMLPGVIEETMNFLSDLPNEFALKIMNSKDYKELIIKNSHKAMKQYWKEMDNRIELIWNTMNYKSQSLLKGIVDFVNNDNFFPALILTRSLLENAAFFHYCLWKIVPTYKNNKEMISKYLKTKNLEYHCLIGSEELENLLLRYSHGTKIDWSKLLKIEELSRQDLKTIQKDLMPMRTWDYMKFLEKNNDYKHAYKYYSAPCDFSHPNVGTNRIFFRTSEITNEKTTEIYVKSPQQIRLFFILVPYPIKISCEIIRGGIEVLQKIKFIES